MDERKDEHYCDNCGVYWSDCRCDIDQDIIDESKTPWEDECEE